MISLFVCTPCYGGQSFMQYNWSCQELKDLCFHYNIPIQFSYLGNESLIHRGRNELVAQFLQTEHSHLIFLDADIGFKGRDLLSLIMADKDVIGGAYPRKMISWSNVRKALALDPNISDELLAQCAGDVIFKTVTPDFKVNEPVEAIHIGTGCMAIKRHVIAGLATDDIKHIESNTPDGKIAERWSIFDTGLNEQGEFLSEDFWFCALARRKGFKVWLAPWVELTHTGTYTFKGSIPVMSQIASKAQLNPEKQLEK